MTKTTDVCENSECVWGCALNWRLVVTTNLIRSRGGSAALIRLPRAHSWEVILVSNGWSEARATKMTDGGIDRGERYNLTISDEVDVSHHAIRKCCLAIVAPWTYRWAFNVQFHLETSDWLLIWLGTSTALQCKHYQLFAATVAITTTVVVDFEESDSEKTTSADLVFDSNLCGELNADARYYIPLAFSQKRSSTSPGNTRLLLVVIPLHFPVQLSSIWWRPEFITSDREQNNWGALSFPYLLPFCLSITSHSSPLYVYHLICPGSGKNNVFSVVNRAVIGCLLSWNELYSARVDVPLTWHSAR